MRLRRRASASRTTEILRQRYGVLVECMVRTHANACSESVDDTCRVSETSLCRAALAGAPAFCYCFVSAAPYVRM